MRVRLLCLGCAVLASLALAPAAAGHVTINPEEWVEDDFARFDIRVPTERGVPTTEVSVQLPEGVFFVSFQPKAGWKRDVKMEKLAEPVELFGDKITERVASVTWSGGQILPGEFDEFGMSAKLPKGAGKEIVFPAVQTYANGEVVRWIGPPDAEEPAPHVKLTAAQGEEPAAATQPAAPAGGDGDDDGGTDALTIVALVLGAAGLAAGLAALLSRSRERGRTVAS